MKVESSKILQTAISAVVIASSLCFAAYVGHENDRDMNAFLKVYPALKGTVLDDCSVCHKGGKVKSDEEKVLAVNSCDYCHTVFKDEGKGIELTLNAYGLDYHSAGRNEAALSSIADKDSDGDGYANSIEIKERTLPGASWSSQEKSTAEHVIFSLEEMKKLMPVVKYTIFVNVHKSADGDTYNTYEGFRMVDILETAGISDKAESIDVFAADGYRKTFLLKQLRQVYKQGSPVFGLGREDLGECGWVGYGGENLKEGESLPAAQFILAFKKNGKKLTHAVFNPKTGKINGEGPFRCILPQSKFSPPDISEYATQECVEKVDPRYRYNEKYEKNADFAVKAVTAIRINPLPDGRQDFPWQEEALRYLSEEKILIYGATAGD